MRKGRSIVLISMAILGSLTLHLLFVQGSAILFNINIIFGKVLAICGLNGIYVTEKPVILWLLYPIFIAVLITAGTIFICFTKDIIESLFFKDADKEYFEKQ